MNDQSRCSRINQKVQKKIRHKYQHIPKNLNVTEYKKFLGFQIILELTFKKLICQVLCLFRLNIEADNERIKLNLRNLKVDLKKCKTCNNLFINVLLLFKKTELFFKLKCYSLFMLTYNGLTTFLKPTNYNLNYSNNCYSVYINKTNFKNAKGCLNQN